MSTVNQLLIFIFSDSRHSTYYRHNDRWIMDVKVRSVIV